MRRRDPFASRGRVRAGVAASGRGGPDRGQAQERCAYLARLPSGNKINLFFYDGAVSQAVAFEKLLDSGEAFANRLKTGFSDKRTWPQLMHIATDGETYGHHHSMATWLSPLRWTRLIPSTTSVSPTTENFWRTIRRRWKSRSWRTRHGVAITAWSVGEVIAAATQAARDGTRHGGLRCVKLSITCARAAVLFEEKGSALLKDPWDARNHYIEVVLNRSDESLWLFFEAHSRRNWITRRRFGNAVTGNAAPRSADVHKLWLVL